MNMIIQRKAHFNIGLLFLFLVVLAACKKDETGLPAVAFEIDNFYPNSGNAGTLVTVEGQGFGADISQYASSISGRPAEVISATPTALVIRIPEGGSTGVLSLKYGDQNYELGTYTYQDLSVKSVFPANGPKGGQISINGEGFSSTAGPAAVFINDKPALVVSLSDTLIVAEIPEQAGSGPIMVKVNGKETKGQNFTYQEISEIKPLSGGKNTKVVISGEGFELLPKGNVVDFNGTAAIVLESSAENLVVVAPEGVTTGPLSVSINGQKIPGPAFTVVAPPSIDVVTPLSGPQGSEMTITGKSFSSVTDENQVYVNGVAVAVKAATGTQLKLTIPGGTGSGLIRVVVNDQAVNGPLFKDQTLGIVSVSPDNGLAGSEVTIKGSGFSIVAGNNKVYFNGIMVPVKSATENSLVLNAPMGLTTGDLKVVVDGQEALAPQGFRRAGVMTLAGGPTSDVFGAFMAGMDVDQSGNVYVTDRENKVVKKISPDGTVSTLRSNGADIIFNTPYGIVIDKQNNIFVSDIGANHIRKITPAGQVSTVISGFSPGLMALDNSGNLYVNINAAFAGMNKVNTAGSFSKVAGPLWPMARPAVDAAGNLYYVDSGSSSNNAVSFVPSGGSNLTSWVGSSEAGYLDGTGTRAMFNSISGGVVFYGDGKLIAGDRFNYAIREIDIRTRQATTLLKLQSGFADGAFSEAKIGSMDCMAVDKDGNIYVLDAQNKAVRKIFLK